MYSALKYTVFFLLLLLLQVLLFDNLNLSVYIHPLLYVAFIVLLPMQARPATTLLLGLVLGMCMDFLSGGAGLHTIASLCTAFFRPYVLLLTVGRENLREGGMPTIGRVGGGRFLKYVTMLMLLHCGVFFFFESPSAHYFYLTLVRILLSAIVSIPLVLLSYLAFRRY